MLSPVALAFATVGAFLASRRWSNPVGWLFASWGFVMSFMTFADSYIQPSDSGMRPGAEWVGWAAASVWHPAFVLLVFMLLLFPHGSPPSPRWRPFAYLTMVSYAALVVAAALSPDTVGRYFPGIAPPEVLPTSEVAALVFEVVLSSQLLLLTTATLSLVLRLRQAQGQERQQVKWFVYAVVVAVVVFTGGIFVPGAGYLFPIFAVIPIAAAIAVLRYRLYDIDLLISRTVTYGVLTASLGATYFGLIVGLQALLRPLTGSNDSAIVATTLVVAGLFLPARRRVQGVVDRRFNRRTYDAARAIDVFSARLREQVDLDTLRYDLLAVVDETMEPAKASLWLREAP